MRGKVHKLTVVSQGANGTPGAVVRDSEGRWVSAPVVGVATVRADVRVYRGYIGAVTQSDVPEGVRADTNARLPKGAIVNEGDDVIAETGDPNLDGRYEVIRIFAGPVGVRVILQRYSTVTTA